MGPVFAHSHGTEVKQTWVLSFHIYIFYIVVCTVLLGVVTRNCNVSTWGADARRSRVWGHPGLHNKILWNNNNKNTHMTSFCFNSLFYSVWKRISKKHSGIIEIFMNLWFPILFPSHNWMTLVSTITFMDGMKFIYYLLPINIQHMNDSRNETQFTIHAAGIEWKMLQKRMPFREHCHNILKSPWSINSETVTHLPDLI